MHLQCAQFCALQQSVMVCVYCLIRIAFDNKQTGDSLRKLTREAAVNEVNAHYGLFGNCFLVHRLTDMPACVSSGKM